MSLTVEAHAKVNFTLEVLGARPDGYHELRSLVVPVSLCDTVTVEKADVTSTDSPFGENDLAVKAAKALGVNAAISIVKRIPIGGGLGGGSADAAAVLRALNELYALGHTPEELAAIGAKVGSDVPALVLGGVVMMEGRGEKVERVDEDASRDMAKLSLVLVNPGVKVETRKVFSAWNTLHPSTPYLTSHISYLISHIFPFTLSPFHPFTLSPFHPSLRNDLLAPAISVCPVIGDVLEALRATGAVGVSMSGSGSTCFGLYESMAAANEAAEALRRGDLQFSLVQPATVHTAVCC